MSGWCPSASASCATSLMKPIDSMKLLNLKLRLIVVVSSSFHLGTVGSSPLMVSRSKGCVPTSHGTQCFSVRREASVVSSLLIFTPFQSCVVVSLKVIGNCSTALGRMSTWVNWGRDFCRQFLHESAEKQLCWACIVIIGARVSFGCLVQK